MGQMWLCLHGDTLSYLTQFLLAAVETVNI